MVMVIPVFRFLFDYVEVAVPLKQENGVLGTKSGMEFLLQHGSAIQRGQGCHSGEAEIGVDGATAR